MLGRQCIAVLLCITFVFVGDTQFPKYVGPRASVNALNPENVEKPLPNLPSCEVGKNIITDDAHANAFDGGLTIPTQGYVQELELLFSGGCTVNEPGSSAKGVHDAYAWTVAFERNLSNLNIMFVLKLTSSSGNMEACTGSQEKDYVQHIIQDSNLTEYTEHQLVVGACDTVLSFTATTGFTGTTLDLKSLKISLHVQLVSILVDEALPVETGLRSFEVLHDGLVNTSKPIVREVQGLPSENESDDSEWSAPFQMLPVVATDFVFIGASIGLQAEGISSPSASRNSLEQPLRCAWKTPNGNASSGTYTDYVKWGIVPKQRNVDLMFVVVEARIVVDVRWNLQICTKIQMDEAPSTLQCMWFIESRDSDIVRIQFTKPHTNVRQITLLTTVRCARRISSVSGSITTVELLRAWFHGTPANRLRRIRSKTNSSAPTKRDASNLEQERADLPGVVRSSLTVLKATKHMKLQTRKRAMALPVNVKGSDEEVDREEDVGLYLEDISSRVHHQNHEGSVRKRMRYMSDLRRKVDQPRPHDPANLEAKDGEKWYDLAANSTPTPAPSRASETEVVESQVGTSQIQSKRPHRSELTASSKLLVATVTILVSFTVVLSLTMLYRRHKILTARTPVVANVSVATRERVPVAAEVQTVTQRHLHHEPGDNRDSLEEDLFTLEHEGSIVTILSTETTSTFLR